MLSTFGLISPGKGIEIAIEAHARDRRAAPRGAATWSPGGPTPRSSSRKASATGSRSSGCVRDLGLGDHVHFHDRFLTVEELAFLLAATDLYLTPYRSRGADRLRGADVRHRRRLPRGLDAVPLRRGPAARRRRRPRAVRRPAGAGRRASTSCSTTPSASRRGARRHRARRRPWPGRRSGAQTARRAARGARARRRRRVPAPRSRSGSARSALDHLLTLVDDVGIVEHADGVLPNRRSRLLRRRHGAAGDRRRRAAIASPARRRYQRMRRPGARVPALRLGAAGPRHAQPDVLRPALAGRAARRAITSVAPSGRSARCSPPSSRSRSTSPSACC